MREREAREERSSARTGRKAGFLVVIVIVVSCLGCHAIDHKYWNCITCTKVTEAEWRQSYPDTNSFLSIMAFLLIDLPIYPVTFGHDVYAFFALEDEGLLPGDAPLPNAPPRGDVLPPPPPDVVITMVEPNPQTYSSPPAIEVEVLDE